MNFVGPKWLWKYQKHLIVIPKDDRFILSGSKAPSTAQLAPRFFQRPRRLNVTFEDEVCGVVERGTQTICTSSVMTQTEENSKPLGASNPRSRGKKPDEACGSQVEGIVKPKRIRIRKKKVVQAVVEGHGEDNVVEGLETNVSLQNLGLSDVIDHAIEGGPLKRTSEPNEFPAPKRRRRRKTTLDIELDQALAIYKEHAQEGQAQFILDQALSSLDPKAKLLEVIGSQSVQVNVNCTPSTYTANTVEKETEIITILDDDEEVSDNTLSLVQGEDQHEEGEDEGGVADKSESIDVIEVVPDHEDDEVVIELLESSNEALETSEPVDELILQQEPETSKAYHGVEASQDINNDVEDNQEAPEPSNEVLETSDTVDEPVLQQEPETSEVSQVVEASQDANEAGEDNGEALLPSEALEPIEEHVIHEQVEAFLNEPVDEHVSLEEPEISVVSQGAEASQDANEVVEETHGPSEAPEPIEEHVTHEQVQPPGFADFFRGIDEFVEAERLKSQSSEPQESIDLTILETSGPYEHHEPVDEHVQPTVSPQSEDPTDSTSPPEQPEGSNSRSDSTGDVENRPMDGETFSSNASDKLNIMLDSSLEIDELQNFLESDDE